MKPSMPSESPFSRRDFIVTVLASGFALAVRPVSAATITTSAEGLTAGEVQIPVADGATPAYRARPSEGSRFPTVAVVQEIFGVHEHIRDVCRRLAKLGYCAVAPELYARHGDVSTMTDVKEILEKVVSKVPDKQVLADLDATFAWAAKQDKGDAKRQGLTGFCWGGRIVWLYAAHSKNLRAGVAWYGRLTSPVSDNTPEASARRRRGAQGAGARTRRRRRPGHPARHGGADARTHQASRRAFRDRGVPGCAACVSRGLPPELSRRAGAGRLAAHARIGSAATAWPDSRESAGRFL